MHQFGLKFTLIAFFLSLCIQPSPILKLPSLISFLRVMECTLDLYFATKMKIDKVDYLQYYLKNLGVHHQQ